MNKHSPLILFIVLNLLGVFFHECWRDELQAVLIANASSSPWDLISRTSRYEATPVLWHLILYFISFGKVLPLIVKLLNSFFIIGAASLFWFHFPVSRLLKTLLLFNYFFLYEYGLVARPYSMGIFLVFFYLSYRNAKNSKLKGAAVISLGLSCLSSLYASFVAIPLLIMRSFELYKSASKRSLLYEVVCFSVFFFISIMQMIPPADRAMAPLKFVWNTKDFLFALGNQSVSLLYVPDLKLLAEWQSTNFGFFAENFSTLFLLLTGTFLLLLVGIYLYRLNPLAAFSYLLGALLFLGFSYVVFLGSLRHSGYFWVLVASLYWLVAESLTMQQRSLDWPFALDKIIVYFLAILSMFSGAYFYASDLRYPFSDAFQTAAHIQRQDKPVVVTPFFVAASLSGYLKGRPLLHLNTMEEATYARWTNSVVEKSVTPQDLKLWMLNKHINEFLFVSNEPVHYQVLSKFFQVQELYKSEFCLVRDECFVLYDVKLTQ